MAKLHSKLQAPLLMCLCFNVQQYRSILNLYYIIGFTFYGNLYDIIRFTYYGNLNKYQADGHKCRQGTWAFEAGRESSAVLGRS